MAGRENRQCRPTFWQGIRPSWANLYREDEEIRKYSAASAIVMISGGLSSMITSILNGENNLPPVHCQYSRYWLLLSIVFTVGEKNPNSVLKKMLVCSRFTYS